MLRGKGERNLKKTKRKRKYQEYLPKNEEHGIPAISEHIWLAPVEVQKCTGEARKDKKKKVHAILEESEEDRQTLRRTHDRGVNGTHFQK